MVSRSRILVLALLGLPVWVGCGGYTDDNVPEKVITKEEMDQFHEAQRRFGELGGARGLGAPPAAKSRPAKAPGR
jgi:hypothetical protein